MHYQSENHEIILKQLQDLSINLIETTLKSAVSKESVIALKLKEDLTQQENLQQSIRGLSILSYFTFLQAHLTDVTWESLRNVNAPIWSNLNADSDIFDLLRYSRDCYGHNWKGELFSASQPNTIRFRRKVITKGPSIGVSTENGLIKLEQQAVDATKELVIDIINSFSDSDLVI